MEFKPSAGEIGNLWKYYVANQAHLCFLEYWQNHAEDEDLKAILQQSKNDATQIVEGALELYTRAGFPKPIGFSLDKDVVPESPRLMSDKLILFVLQVLSEYGVYGYGLALGKTETPEVLEFFKRNLTNAADLYQTITHHVVKKGLEKQKVFIPAPKQAEMVEKPSFLAGWLGEQRRLTSIEIDNLVLSLRGVILAESMFTVLTQIAKNKKLQKFCERGLALCKKRVERFQALNHSENIPYQATFESEITDSTVSPFSDKLIMFEAMSLSEIAIARYGNALSTCTRRDLNTLLASYIVETGTYVDDGLNVMIESHWLEQPPMAVKK